ncbi:MAG: hypothetical protein JWQ27_3032 [Ferruginibacter sp.]|nr:hypothetical protein [Ferruginibacter sp.]
MNMKMLKGFLVALIGLFIVITLLSLLIPSKVLTVKGIPVYAPKEKVVAALADLRNWKNWHPVFMNDSSIKFSEPSSGVNAFAEWNSGNKTNRFNITSVGPNEIRIALKRAGENDVENVLTILPLESSNGFQVEWKALTKLKWYPWEKFAGIFVDKITGPGYETALNSLKEYLEKRP